MARECATVQIPLPVCVDAEEVWKATRRWHAKKREHYLALYLDARLHVKRLHVVSIGTVNSGLAHPREVFIPALAFNALRVIVAHNHPSGDPIPSKEDVEVAGRLWRAGEVVGIAVEDMVIVCPKGYCSLRAQKVGPWKGRK